MTARRGVRAVTGLRALIALVAVGTVVVGCGQGLPFVGGDDAQYLDAGKALIEGDLANRIGFGPLEATCRGRSLGAGDAFACTAMSADHPPIEFVGTISGDGESVDLDTTNLLVAEQVEQIEVFAASLIAQETGSRATAEHFECADSSLVVAPGGTIACLFTDPADATIFDVTVTVEDLTDLSIAVAVGDPIG